MFYSKEEVGNAVNAREIRKNVKKRFKALWGGHEPKTGSPLVKNQPFWVRNDPFAYFIQNFSGRLNGTIQKGKEMAKGII